MFCDNCRPIESRQPLDITLVGNAQDVELELPPHQEAENSILQDGDLIYHYFIDDETIFNSITNELIVKSHALCACEECIRESLHTNKPHYGDGAYCTYNNNLFPTLINPMSIINAHGLDPINFKVYRAVILIKKASCFRKFFKTGGVVRSQPALDKLLRRNQLIGHNIEEAEVIRIEKWDGKSWIFCGSYEK